MKQNTTLENQYVLITQTEDRRQTDRQTDRQKPRYILYNARVALRLDSILPLILHLLSYINTEGFLKFFNI